MNRNNLRAVEGGSALGLFTGAGVRSPFARDPDAPHARILTVST